MEKPDLPRRRVEVSIKIGADSWEDLQGALRCLETEISMDGKLSRSSVSGGYSFGWIVESDEDEAITHDSWASANDAWCAKLKESRNVAEPVQTQ